MNFLLIFVSIFCLGVSAGLVLGHMLTTQRDVLPNPRKKKWDDWKSQR